MAKNVNAELSGYNKAYSTLFFLIHFSLSNKRNFFMNNDKQQILIVLMNLKKSAGMKGMALCASDSCHNNGDIGLENLIKRE